MANDMTQALQLAFDKLGELAAKYGPPAVDTAAEVIRMNAVQSVVTTVVIAALGAAATTYGAFFLRRGIRVGKEEGAARQAKVAEYNAAGKVYYGLDDTSNAELPIGVGLGLLALGGIFLAAALIRATHVWTWIALWNPKLALAAKIVNALPGIGQ